MKIRLKKAPVRVVVQARMVVSSPPHFFFLEIVRKIHSPASLPVNMQFYYPLNTVG
jgi:hypothetical protein